MAQAKIDPTAEKPSLHDIAAMPYPSSLNAMRKHYNPDWGKVLPDGVETKRTFSVEVRYSYRGGGRETVEVEAWNEEEAEELAADEVAENAEVPYDCDIEIDDCRIVGERSEQVSA